MTDITPAPAVEAAPAVDVAAEPTVTPDEAQAATAVALADATAIADGPAEAPPAEITETVVADATAATNAEVIDESAWNLPATDLPLPPVSDSDVVVETGVWQEFDPAWVRHLVGPQIAHRDASYNLIATYAADQPWGFERFDGDSVTLVAAAV